jgi:hypothetical protein
MYLSGPPLHVLALHLLKRVRDALGPLSSHVLTSFSAGVDVKNFADVLSLNLVPVTVCTDMLKVPGYEKSPEYLHALAEKIDLLHQQALLDFHKLVQAEIEKATVFPPNLIPPSLSQ